MRADKLYVNGKIFTVNKSRKWAEAVAVEGNKIVYVGDRAGADAVCDANTEICDLDGKLMLPGFIDGHCHPIFAAYVLSGIVFDIDWSLEECLEAVKRYVKEHPDNETYFGMGYAEWLFDEHGPAKEVLDEICPDKPVMLLGSGGHEAWANSKTFEVAGITKDTKDPVPGLHYFARDKEGNPSGHIAEERSQAMIFNKINFFDESKIKAILEQDSADYAAMGVTGLNDVGIFSTLVERSYKAYDSIKNNEISYKQRIAGTPHLICDVEATDDVLETMVKARGTYNDDKVRINLMKILNDGTMESRTAALTEPYPEDGSIVEPLMNQEQAAEAGLKAAKKGFNVNMHAIGDNAIKSVIAMGKAIREAGYDDIRVTCSHTQYVADEDLELFGKYNIIANSTGVWMYGNPFMDKVLGEINNKTFRMKSLIDGGARMSLGSDFPVDEYGREPLKSIEMCATRQMYDQPDSPVLKPEDEKTTVEDAIEGFTINNAYQMGMDDVTGTIETGKYADFVILEENILDMPLENIHKVKVCETIMDGVTTYKA